jgi:hypothetical protein
MPASCLTVATVLEWADAHHKRTGRWPHVRSGPVAGAPGQTWGAVNRALARGSRGLPGGSSLARLLGEKRGRRNQAQAPPLTAGQILLWADAHFRRTGRLPNANSGAALDAPGESWSAVASALYAGNRGLPGGETLAQFLRRHGRDAPGRRQGEQGAGRAGSTAASRGGTADGRPATTSRPPSRSSRCAPQGRGERPSFSAGG